MDGSTVDVEFIQELELADGRGAGDGFVGAEIPYVGGEFSMLVIVPDEGRFAEIRDGLGQPFLDEVDTNFTTGSYELQIPACETNTQIDLVVWLFGHRRGAGQLSGHHPGSVHRGGRARR